MVASPTSYASRRTTDQRSNYAAQKASGYAGEKRMTMEVLGCHSPNPLTMIDSSKQRRREAMSSVAKGSRLFPSVSNSSIRRKSCFALSLYISHIKIEIADKGLRLMIYGCCRSYDPKAALGMFLVCSTVDGGHTKPWSPRKEKSLSGQQCRSKALKAVADIPAAVNFKNSHQVSQEEHTRPHI